MSSEPQLFIPHALSRLTPERESFVPRAKAFITRDLTMPEKDWASFDVPTYLRARDAS